MSEIIEFPMDRVRKPRAEAEERAEALSQILELKTQKLSDRIDEALAQQGLSAEAPYYSKKEFETIKALGQEAIVTSVVDWSGYIPNS